MLIKTCEPPSHALICYMLIIMSGGVLVADLFFFSIVVNNEALVYQVTFDIATVYS